MKRPTFWQGFKQSFVSYLKCEELTEISDQIVAAAKGEGEHYDKKRF